MESKDYQIIETTIVLPNITWEQYYSSVEWKEAFDFFLREYNCTWRLEYKLDSLYWHNAIQCNNYSYGYTDQPSFRGQVSLRVAPLNPDWTENNVLFRFFIGQGGMLMKSGGIHLSINELEATTPTTSTMINIQSNEPATYSKLVIGVIYDNSLVNYKPRNPLRSHVSEAFVDLLRCTNYSMGDAQFEVEDTIIGTQKARLVEKSDYFKTMISQKSQNATTTPIDIPDGTQKARLAEESNYFKTIISQKSQNATTTPIVIPDVMYENFAKILAYLYSDQIEVPEFDSAKFRDLYAASVKYMLTDLTAILDQDIERKITIHNVSSFLFEFAFQYEKHRQTLVSFIASKLSQVRQTDEFKKVLERKSELEEYAELMTEILMFVTAK